MHAQSTCAKNGSPCSVFLLSPENNALFIETKISDFEHFRTNYFESLNANSLDDTNALSYSLIFDQHGPSFAGYELCARSGLKGLKGCEIIGVPHSVLRTPR